MPAGLSAIGMPYLRTASDMSLRPRSTKATNKLYTHALNPNGCKKHGSARWSPQHIRTHK